ncbi:MAG: glyoxylase-like metal-dependent hydrolase (beta-lactamase superfamily II) [Flavobacterium sp.]|jgi:glyoxylase-like metal-dependent hydrolase (beta-lactamase superfamily II)
MQMMSKEELSAELEFPYSSTPEPGAVIEVAPGVKWLRMPLPMSLNHINLYLIKDGLGWVVVDTGIRGEETSNLWHKIFDHALEGLPVTKVICTHLHPDHTGQAGFLCHHWNVPLLMSYSEYYQATFINTMMRERSGITSPDYLLKLGFTTDFLNNLESGTSSFQPTEDDIPFPKSFDRLVDGQKILFDHVEWSVITGNGHSPEHVCLYCPSLRLLISGDQILPIITSNVSVYPTEPEANPMKGWLYSHEKFIKKIPDDVLVLPAHNLPFYGLHKRLEQLIEHHEDRMLVLEENCVDAKVATDLLPLLFSRKLEGFTKIMAVGECVAHLHCLMDRKRIQRSLKGGIYYYQSISPDLSDRANPDHHEEPEEYPLLT